MKTRSRKLRIESLESRSVLSATALADFNGDGLMDVAAITDPNTILVSLANPDGSYAVSDVLKAPRNQPIQDVGLWDFDDDGDLDIVASGSKNSDFYSHLFRSNADGTFDYVEPVKWKFPKWFV